MAVIMTSSHTNPPDIQGLVTPLLSALPGAAIASQPAPAILPLLSPILRQRVQLLSSASNEPWIRLLTYDTAKAPRLARIAQGGSLQPHPVSGEIEVDWDYNVQIKYRRLDQETLQTLVVLGEFELFLRLVYCTGDAEGGGDGWRVGEVGVAGDSSLLTSFGGSASLDEAERAFQTSSTSAGSRQTNGVNGASTGQQQQQPLDEDEDDDDDYWDRYDATPARTPAVKRSPAPQSIAHSSNLNIDRSASAEDAYYAQYDSVQPAMDNHDPDEESEYTQTAPPLGLAQPASSWETTEQSELDETSGAWTLAEPPRSSSGRSSRSHDDEEREAHILHPRPESSASSNGSLTVAKLEESAEKRDQSEFGVKQHISRSIRSLFMLSRASGIDLEEFQRTVKTELEVLGMVEDDM